MPGLQGKVEVHPSLNLCKDVVTLENFASETEADLKYFFEPECEVNVHMICRKVNDIFVPLATLTLTLN